MRLVAALVLSSGLVAAAVEPDVKLMQSEMANLKSYEKYPLPVYSKGGGKGRIDLESAEQATWLSGTGVFIGSMGWCEDCSVHLAENSVFVNVGPLPVTVGNLIIQKGEYVSFEGKRFAKVTAASLAESAQRAQAAREATRQAASTPPVPLRRKVADAQHEAVKRPPELGKTGSANGREQNQRTQPETALEEESVAAIPAPATPPRLPNNARSAGMVPPPATQESRWPSFTRKFEGKIPIVVKNPNPQDAKIGLRSGDAGLDFTVAAGKASTVHVPAARFQVYVRYAKDPASYRTDDIDTSTGNGVRIELTMSSDGNLPLQRVP